MFKLSVDKVINSTYIVDSCDVWHARLGHLNFNSMKYMRKIGYIYVSDFNVKNKCEICIQAKITRKPFPKS